MTTTTPEELAFALQWFILPLARIGVPVSEVIFTLMLSLRFIDLLFDEVRLVISVDALLTVICSASSRIK